MPYHASFLDNSWAKESLVSVSSTPFAEVVLCSCVVHRLHGAAFCHILFQYFCTTPWKFKWKSHYIIFWFWLQVHIPLNADHGKKCGFVLRHLYHICHSLFNDSLCCLPHHSGGHFHWLLVFALNTFTFSSHPKHLLYLFQIIVFT